FQTAHFLHHSYVFRMLRPDSGDKTNQTVTAKRYILVVDDDRMSRQLLVRLLSRDGFEAVDCETAREAMQLIEASPPALLVSDYEMPEFNGAELCYMVR